MSEAAGFLAGALFMVSLWLAYRTFKRVLLFLIADVPLYGRRDERDPDDRLPAFLSAPCPWCGSVDHWCSTLSACDSIRPGAALHHHLN